MGTFLGGVSMATFDSDLQAELREMVRCVQLYFREQKQQREIADELEISRSKVSRLLKRASTEGFVKIDFDFPLLPKLAAEVAEHFQLRDVEVIPTGLETEIKEDLGIATARYFERTAGKNVKVGLSCGLTLYHMVNHLREGYLKDLHIYPLSTENSLRSVDLFPNTLVGMMAAKYRPHVNAFALPATILGSDEKAGRSRDLMFDKPEVKKIYREAHEVDVAMIGIGSVDANTPGFCALARQSNISPMKLSSLGAVGEFNYQLIDKEGKAVNNRELRRVRNRVTGVSLDHFRKMSVEHGKLVIAIGGGTAKVAAIRAVLNGRLCNVLITAQDTAETLLERPA